MRSIGALAIALALVAGTTEARADLVTYNLTGTIQNVSSWGEVNANVAAGDHITWTMQYDRSAAPGPGSSSTQAFYALNGPVFTNIVDQTTGYHFFTPSTIGPEGTNVNVSRYITIGGIFSLADNTPILTLPSYGADLFLSTISPVPTVDLAKLQLSSISWDNTSSYFTYGRAWGDINNQFSNVDPNPTSFGLNFNSSVDSVSAASVAGVPEPGSLTLFLLGAAALAARCFRSRLRGVWHIA